MNETNFRLGRNEKWILIETYKRNLEKEPLYKFEVLEDLR